MDTFLGTIFTDESAEFTDIQTLTPTVDFTDWPLTPDLLSPFTTNTNFYITSQISEHGYFEIEFMLGASAFWGCNMNFGNSQCGIDIRQGIAHLIDKTKFTNPTTGEPTIRGISSPIDNPLPTSNGGLPSPNPCGSDNGVIPSSQLGSPTDRRDLRAIFATAPVPGTMLETGSQCVVGAAGGTSYHLATASGTGTPSNWQTSVSDLDFCAAAAHFIDAGLATGIVNNSTSVATRNCTLTGRAPAVTTNGIVFFVRLDNTPRLHLGDSYAQVICALFTGAYTTGCGTNPTADNILKVQHGPITAFTGFTTSTDHVDVSWHAYTAAFGGIFPFDISLFLIYNSRFVSGISSIHVANGGTCANDSVPTASAGDYMYLCSTNFDSLSNRMEFAPCLTATGDPTPGQTTPTFGTCTPGGSSSAISAGYQAEDAFSRGAFTVPVFQQADQFGSLRCSPSARPCDSAAGIAASWTRGINHFGAGLPNFFTWLDAWNQNPTQPGTIRQGFKQTTRSISPFIASTVWDGYIEGNVYDALHVINPLNNAEDLSWMDISTLPQTSLTYTPPGGACVGGVAGSPPGCTVLTYRMTLMPNLSWQDGRPVTAFDVAFSYGTMLANGAFQSGGASVLTGVTILSPTQFDLNIKSFGPFTKLTLTGIPIFPGRYWTCGTGTQPSSGVAPNIIPAKCAATASANWDSAITTCTSVGNTCYPVQYSLGTAPAQSACYPQAASPCSLPAVCSLSGCASFVANLMNVDATKTGALYDPIKDHSFIGSSAWTCGTGAGLGQNCAPGGIMNPGVGQSYTLQRNGLGITPGFPGDYFRSSGFLATYLWTGDLPGGVNNFSAAKACFGVTPLDPLSASPPASACGHWQQGIGTNGATTPAGTGGCPAGATPCGIPVGSNQVSIVKLYININWVYSDIWNSANPPNGIIPLDPLLYAGSGGTLSPAAGTGSVGCASAYPAGGYDC
jgi:hypothetical protein